jgi:hypothetical protein
LAEQKVDINEADLPVLAKNCLEDGRNTTKRELTALSRSKLIFVEKLIELCSSYRCKIFATINDGISLEDDEPDFLRKDYVYLFERYFYYLDDKPEEPSGIIVFDELEKSKSHILIGQIENYFKKTTKGRTRSSLIIPEPFFVHSDLTTGVQIADIFAYLISWGFRLNGMEKPVREELLPFVELLKQLRYRTTRGIEDVEELEVWSVVYL